MIDARMVAMICNLLTRRRRKDRIFCFIRLAAFLAAFVLAALELCAPLSLPFSFDDLAVSSASLTSSMLLVW
jgi:hypothetical protein